MISSALIPSVSLIVYPDSEQFNISNALRYIAEVFMINGVSKPSISRGGLMIFDAPKEDLIKNLAKASIEINRKSGLDFCVVMNPSISEESFASFKNSITDAIAGFVTIKPFEPQPQPQPQPQPGEYGYDYDYGYGYNGSDYEVASVPQPRKCMKVVGTMINPRTGQMVTFYDSCQRDDIALGLVP